MSDDQAVPSVVRIDNLFLGGKDNYEWDQDWAAWVAAEFPQLPQAVRDNQAFLERGVAYLAGDLGIGQFLVIGTALPVETSVHQVAQRHRPDARVVYVDPDPIVLALAQALLAGRPEGVTASVNAEVGDAERILAEASNCLDFAEPVALLMLGVRFLDEPDLTVKPLLDALSPGSRLLMSHALTGDAMNGVIDRYRETLGAGVARTRAEISALIAPWAWDERGLGEVNTWRARNHPGDVEPAGEQPATGYFVGGVACPPPSDGDSVPVRAAQEMATWVWRLGRDLAGLRVSVHPEQDVTGDVGAMVSASVPVEVPESAGSAEFAEPSGFGLAAISPWYTPPPPEAVAVLRLVPRGEDGALLWVSHQRDVRDGDGVAESWHAGPGEPARAAAALLDRLGEHIAIRTARQDGRASATSGGLPSL